MSEEDTLSNRFPKNLKLKCTHAASGTDYAYQLNTTTTFKQFKKFLQDDLGAPPEYIKIKYNGVSIGEIDQEELIFKELAKLNVLNSKQFSNTEDIELEISYTNLDGGLIFLKVYRCRIYWCCICEFDLSNGCTECGICCQKLQCKCMDNGCECDFFIERLHCRCCTNQCTIL